ncbi:tRNA (adenosine(37)-N6)-threonylcarbamoyltransferase complex dimerization subunit type 1 TsaB [Caldibacillus sp. 210928-DFI.2.22]|uniref:tRNA (adenosine(37)-N6)-threonylcarbamoyltransferase complex dimerization subunit type 1 TsaB n=1 Tax=unclassified Caldibacillus TaxID=2641266 RepID=UPI001D076DB1|nr:MULTISPECIES: tRNA (adenosine(37)-N6)-threonylcarbamoyltransferase complex dimerization subunit type 1 TsaB [unclassified Caldibacillus]MCB7069644.1 tRNA (adenosine(37)-N6)-threonylcarbamoyltransferase complex dimerization subunit type 1 TsaB [Caldibacillus sp. 210928-DFI.2.22]MCB7073023.1 tRNA (adenosine(37)-N6)-threonylcarbamoyltransferase complex dimerization subunit type 1 TsaB [Caldibacillus sp. 210928-DFI.2.18]
MNILAIDTSTNVLGVGIASNEKIIGEYITNIKRNHSTRVLPAIDFLLKDCGMDIKEINKIIVANGPGSYTGLRIGLTIGKTLAWTLNIPIVGVSSLKLMAASARYFDGYISPVMDARRGNIFTGLYEYKEGKLMQAVNDQHIPTEEWCKLLKTFDKPVLFLGNDVVIHEQVIVNQLAKQVQFAPITVNIPKPGELALLAKDLKEKNVHSFAPNYLRLAEAEAKWREKTN